MASPLADYLSKHSLSAGDRVSLTWKNAPLEGTILPQPSDEQSFLKIKLDSGYNMGVALTNIQRIEKIAHPLASPAHLHDIPVPNSSPSAKRPGFSLIGVGGTIVSKVNYETGGVIAKMTPAELSSIVPGIKEFSEIRNVVSPFTKMSEDNNPSDWVRIAQACHEELIKPDVEGVVVSHGTDTLHYTAAALSFMLPSLSKPVVVVGSQRSSDRGSSDAEMNLICAVRLAVSDFAEVGTCMHGDTSDSFCFFIRGSSVRKMHTSRRDAFRPINRLPLAKVWQDGKIEVLSPFHKRSTGETKLDAVFEENVALIKFFPGMSPSMLEDHVKRGCKGFVIEATGLGGVRKELIPAIHSVTQKGIPVFIVSQTIYGRVNLNVYSYGRQLQEAGAVGLEDMLSETAYVKLGWVLGHTKDMLKVKEMMLTNYAGEISLTSRADTFLN